MSGGARISLLLKGVDEKVCEVTDGGMHCEKFSIKGGMPGFRRRGLSAEECEWLPGTMEDLFKDRADGNVAGIGREHERKTRHWKLEICCGGKGLFHSFEGGFSGGGPRRASWVYW